MRIAIKQPIVWIILVASFAEAVLLKVRSDSVFILGYEMIILASSVLVLNWAILGLVAWLTQKFLFATAKLLPKPLIIAGATASFPLLFGGVLFYFASWGLYLQSGRFAACETIRFAIANPRMLLLHMVDAQPTDLRRFVFLTLALFTVVVFLLRAHWNKRGWCSFDSIQDGRKYRISCYISGNVALLALVSVIGLDQSTMRSAMRINRLKNQVNPLVTVVTSGIDMFWGEPIEPCLNLVELASIAECDWNVPDAASMRSRPSVIFVAIESLRHDVIYLRHQGREVTPNLNALAANGIQFTSAYSNSTHSDYSDVSVLSSLYPLRTQTHHYYHETDPWPRTLLYDLLKRDGYATAVISSQNEGWGGMAAFLKSDQLDFFYDAETSGEKTTLHTQDVGFEEEVKSGVLRAGKLADSQTMDVALKWIANQAFKRDPFFLAVNFQSSHFPYLLPPDCERPFQPCAIDFPVSFLNYPADKTAIVRNAYYNAIANCDRQLGRLIARLRELEILDNTILVIYGENGEAFHEVGCVTHAGPPIEPVVHVACAIHAPALVSPCRNPYPVELVDLCPTVLGLLGLPSHPNFQGIDVLSPSRPPADDRTIFFHVENGISRADGILVGGRWKFWHDRKLGAEFLVDLASKESETRNLVNDRVKTAADLRNMLREWRKRQLAYYRYPMYYEKYYPPKAATGENRMEMPRFISPNSN